MKFSLLRFLLWVCALSLCGNDVLAQNINYVSPTGNDLTGTGTKSSPLRTITQAVDRCLDGDAIIVLGGRGDTMYDERVVLEKNVKVMASPKSGRAIHVREVLVRDHRAEVTGFGGGSIITKDIRN